MTALPYPDSSMTEAEYLAFEQKSNSRHEYAGGQILALSGASNNHILIVGNLTTALNVHLSKTPCLVMSIDLQVKVATSYRYPDVTVICDEPDMVGDSSLQSVTNPDIIFEVLSPSTASIDHIQKLDEYTQIESLKSYLLVEQDKSAIKHFRRRPDDTWNYAKVAGLHADIDLPSINYTLKLSDVYAKCKLESDPVDD